MSNLDFLSYVLSFLRVNSSSIFIFDFGEPWGVETSELPVPVSLTVMEGSLWMEKPDAEPIALNRGDTLLLPRGTHGKVHALVSSPGVKRANIEDLFRKANIARMTPGSMIDRPIFLGWGGGGASTRIISAVFGFDVYQLGPLMAALPEVIVVRSSETDPQFLDVLLGNVLNTSFEEPGYATLVAQTAQLLLVHVVRAYALSGRVSDIGWLAGLADPRIARALTSIHREPERDWSVATLARAAGLSRSGFAERFHARMGQTPMQYLRSWRMHLAQESLASGDTTITTLAQNLGYQSEAAFREAFRQTTGLTPREFRRQSPALARHKSAKSGNRRV